MQRILDQLCPVELAAMNEKVPYIVLPKTVATYHMWLLST